MDKAPLHALRGATLPSLCRKCRRPDTTRASLQRMLSMTLSCLGRAHYCDLRVLYRPTHKKILLSCTWNVIDSTNATFTFSFPLDARTLIDMETGFRFKSRKQVLKGCIGSLDGMLFPMKCPGKNMLNSNRYFCNEEGQTCIIAHSLL